MKTFDVPEGKLVTVLVDGVEVSYVPGQEYPDNAEFIVTSPMTEQPCSFGQRGIEPYRAAVMVNAEGVDEANSVKAAIQGGTVTGEAMDGVQIRSTSDDFSATGLFWAGQRQRALGLQWQWNHNPVDSAWSLDERKGWLTLHALPPGDAALASGGGPDAGEF